MSLRRGAAAAALVVGAGVASVVISSPAETPTTRPAPAPPSASPTAETTGPAPVTSPVEVTGTAITALPPIAQQGREASAADDARAVLRVSTTPAQAGIPVQVLRRAGGAWAPQAQAVTGKGGVVEVTVPARAGDQPAVYRAVAGGTSSGEAGPGRWGAPVFSDEFAGEALGPAWFHRGTDYNPEGKRACSKGSPEAATVSGGVLSLWVLPDPTRSDKCPALRRGKPQGPYAYRLNGHVSTEKSYAFTYGIAAARVKFQPEPGQHAAFWMQPESPVPGGYEPRYTGAEIDVIEWFGRGKKTGGLTQFTYHRDSTGQRIKTGGHLPNPDRFLADRDDSWYDAFHVFSVEWTPEEYIFRIDGRESWRSSAGISHRPEFLILSLLSSDYEIADNGDEGLGSQAMEVDWVRVWQE